MLRRCFLVLGLTLSLVVFADAEASDFRLRVGLLSFKGQKQFSVMVQRGKYQVVSADYQGSLPLLSPGESIGLRHLGKGKIEVSVAGFQDVLGSVRLEPLTAASGLRLQGGSIVRLLRGRLDFSARSDVQIVNQLPLEEYLKGVVPSEMFPSWQMEALKSQAVLARTYTMTSRNRRHEGFDLCDKSHCQVFLGAGSENERTTLAVRETAGQIVSIDGVPARIFYHSTCGGMTASPGDVFQLASSVGLPPARNVPDQGQASALCSTSPHFHWQYRLDRTKFQHFLHTLARERGEPGKISKIRILERDSGGRVTWMELVGPTHSCKITGHEFRLRFMRKYGPDSLKSTLFSLTVEPDAIVFQGRGFGHGVGLCQWGAQALAVQGLKYQDILQHYYPQGRISRLRATSSGD